MPIKTTGKKPGRINVKKLKGNAKELTTTQQKKVKGGLAPLAASDLRRGPGGQHNETLVQDIVG